MKILARHFDRALALMLLVIVLGVFWPPEAYFTTTPALPSAGNFSSTAFNAVLLVFLAVACLARVRPMAAMLRSAWPMLPLITLAFCSASWSAAPDVVLVRATKVVTTALFGLYLVGRAGGDDGRGGLADLIAMFVKASLVAAVASVAIFAVAPRYAFSTAVEYAHAWRGAFTDKNELGIAAALGLLFAFYALHRRYGSRLLAGIAIPANLALLFLSQSITAILIVPIGLYFFAIGSALRRRSGPGLLIVFALLAMGLLGAAIAAGMSSDLLLALGRNPTLTNRTRIWEVVIPYIARRPWLGYGLETFWLPRGVEANQVWAILQWQTPHSHNMWLEMCLSLGLVGAALTALLWLSAYWRATRALFAGAGPDAAFALLVLVVIFVSNMTEYSFFRGDDIAWLLFAATYGYLGREGAAAAIRLESPRSVAGAAAATAVVAPRRLSPIAVAPAWRPAPR